MKYITGLKRTCKSDIYRMQFRYKIHRIIQYCIIHKGKAITIMLKKKFELMRVTVSDGCYVGRDMSCTDTSFPVLHSSSWSMVKKIGNPCRNQFETSRSEKACNHLCIKSRSFGNSKQSNTAPCISDNNSKTLRECE